MSEVSAAAAPATTISTAHSPVADGDGAGASSPLKPVMHIPQENAYIESVYESVLLASGMLGHIERGSEELNLLRNAIQDMLHGAMYHTSRSMSLLRLMAYNALNLGRWEEAFLAIRAYLDKDAWSHRPRQQDGLIADAPVERRPEPYRDLACMALAASRAAIHELDQTVEGIRYAEKALDFCVQDERQASRSAAEGGAAAVNNSHIMKSRSYHLIGQGYGQRALEVFDPETRRLYQKKAVLALSEAVRLDADNWEIRYDLAFVFCDLREIRAAVDLVKDAIHLNAGFIQAWHLLCLLLTAQKSHDRALKLCEVAIKKCAECDQDVSSQVINLQLTRALLIEHIHGPDKALETYPNLFRMFTKLFYPLEETLNPRERETKEKEKESGKPDLAKIMRAHLPQQRLASQHQQQQQQDGRGGGEPSSGFRFTAGRLPKYKDFYRNVSSRCLERSDAEHWQVRLWLHSAAMFRRAARFEQAVEAWIEAAKLDPEGVEVWCELGTLHLHRDGAASLQEALHCFKTALSICKTHLPSAVQLGQTYFRLDKLELAEHVLEGATKHGGGVRHDAWYWYAMVLRATGRCDKALQCFAYAAALEQSSPITDSFEVIDRFER